MAIVTFERVTVVCAEVTRNGGAGAPGPLRPEPYRVPLCRVTVGPEAQGGLP